MKRWTGWLLCLAALLPFLSARNFPQVHDDSVLRGPGSLVADPHADAALLLRADLFGTPEEPQGQTGFWRPLVLLGFRAELALAGGDGAAATWLGHCVSLALHAACALLLWRVLLAAGMGDAAAFLAALLFAVHPVHAESVAWISGRGDLGATACALLGTLLVLQAPQTIPTRAAAVLALLAALLFKETAVLLVLLVIPLSRLLRGSWRDGLLAAAPALLGYGLLRATLFTSGLEAGAYTGPEGAVARWFTWLSILPDMLRLLLWPGPATPIHPVSEVARWQPGAVLPGAVTLLALAWLCAWAWREHAAVPAWGLLLLLGTLLLLAPWRRFPTGFPEVAAPLYERYLYAAAAAPAVLLAALLASPLRRRPWLLLLMVPALALPLGWRAAQNSRAWSSDEAFARAGLAAAPRSPNLWNHLGVALLERMRAAPDDAAAQEAGTQALAAFEQALALEPGQNLAELNRFIALAMLRQRDAAEVAADRLLQRRGTDPAVLENIAQWHFGEQRWEPAAALFTRALQTGRARVGTERLLEHCVNELQSSQRQEAQRAPEGLPSTGELGTEAKTGTGSTGGPGPK